MKIKFLEKLASEKIGDSGKPNLFFVSVEPHGVVLISREFDVSYNYWRNLPKNVESALEDRQFGCICTVEPKEEGGKLIEFDDSEMFRESNRTGVTL